MIGQFIRLTLQDFEKVDSHKEDLKDNDNIEQDVDCDNDMPLASCSTSLSKKIFFYFLNIQFFFLSLICFQCYRKYKTNCHRAYKTND